MTWLLSHTAHDNAEADIIKSVLEQEGIPVFLQGYNHRSMLGVVGGYIDINIMVSERDAQRAEQYISEGDVALPSEIESDVRNDEAIKEEKQKEKQPKRWVFAIVLPFLVPGLGSYYVGRGDVGGWLLTFLGISLVVFFLIQNGSLIIGALISIPMLMLIDLVISIYTLSNARRK